MNWKNNAWLRTCRRAAAAFIAAAIANITIQQGVDINTLIVSALVAGLMGLEKFIRELKTTQTG